MLIQLTIWDKSYDNNWRVNIDVEGNSFYITLLMESSYINSDRKQKYI